MRQRGPGGHQQEFLAELCLDIGDGDAVADAAAGRPIALVEQIGGAARSRGAGDDARPLVAVAEIVEGIEEIGPETRGIDLARAEEPSDWPTFHREPIS